MAKERDHINDFKTQDSSLSQYVDLVERAIDSPASIFDDILMVEERYQESNVINQGGMKKILKTTDSLTCRPVAKATLRDFEDSEKVESFLREARLTAALEHPNIIPVYDIGVDEIEGPFFTMKLVGGRNLANILESLSDPEKEEVYTLQDLVQIFLKVCDAIAYAHSRGVLHLDLKPENIQIDDYGEVLVCDWGLAKVLEDPESVSDNSADLDPMLYNGMTLDGYIKGTPGYMAPEQILTEIGPKDKRTDIYALGGILYSLLCFKAPYENDTLDGVLVDTLKGELIPPSERCLGQRVISPSLEAVAMKALELDPQMRYQSVSDLRNEINKWLGGFATEAEEASFLKSFWLLLNRHKAISALLIIFLLSTIFSFYKIKQNEKIAVINANKAKINEQKAIASEQKAIASEQKAIASEQKAIGSEQKAIASEKVARSNEKKAKEALDLYIKEKELKGEVNKYSLKQLLELHQKALGKMRFDKAMNELIKALAFQPENEILNTLKGEIHFYRQEFKLAMEAFDNAGSMKDKSPYALMYKVSEKYSDIHEEGNFVPATKLVELMHSVEGVYRDRLFTYHSYKFRVGSQRSFKDLLKRRQKLENHLEFCRLMTVSGLKKWQIENLRFSYTFDDGGINLNLSGYKNVDPPTRYIVHLPIKTLNVRDSGFWRPWIFSHYYLKSVDITNTPIKFIERDILRDSNLEEIILTKELYEKLRLSSGIRDRIKFTISE